VATLGQDGAPKVRTVALREVSRADRRVAFHTDRRSPKVAEIAAQPRVALHVYSQSTLVQIRMEASARLHLDDEVADAVWEALPLGARLAYTGAAAPGTMLNQPAAAQPEPGPDRAEAGRQNFGVVACAVHKLEWLSLGPGPHRRALFTLAPESRHAAWLQP